MKIVLLLCGLLIAGVFAAPNVSVMNPAHEDCNQNDVDGMGPVVGYFWENFFPLLDFLTITLEYLSNDEEVQRVFAHLESEEFLTIVDLIAHKDEFIVVLEYFCVELKLNIYFYMNSLGGLFGFPEVSRPPGASSAVVMQDFELEPGFVGYLNAIRNAFPSEEIEAWWEVEQENQYVIDAMEKLKSDYFRTVAEAVQELEEFEELVESLEELGVPARQIIIDMYTWLGWEWV